MHRKLRNYSSKNKQSISNKIRNSIDYNSPVIINYILICFLLYAINILTKGYINSICYLPGNLIVNIFAVHRLLTYTFVHGSFEHLISNMALLALTGPSVEKKYGGGIVIGLILINSIMIGSMQGVLIHQSVLGASSIVFMFLMLSVFADTETEKIPFTMFIVATCYIGNEVLSALVPDAVSQLSHIMGAVIGLLFGILYRKVKDAEKEKQEISKEIEDNKKVIKKHFSNYISTLKSTIDRDTK